MTPEQERRINKIADKLATDIAALFTLCPPEPTWQDDEGWKGLVSHCQSNESSNGLPCTYAIFTNGVCRGVKSCLGTDKCWCPHTWDRNEPHYQPPTDPRTITAECPEGKPYLTYQAWLADQPKPEPPLKPCAHCGHEIKITARFEGDKLFYQWHCPHCRIGISEDIGFSLQSMCIDHANRRPELPEGLRGKNPYLLPQDVIHDLQYWAKADDNHTIFSYGIFKRLGIDWRK